MPSLKQQQAKLNFLERYGLEYLRRCNTRDEWAVRKLAPAELQELKHVEQETILRAALAGVVSGAVLGGAEILIWTSEPQLTLWREQLPNWGVFLGLALVVSGAEVFFFQRKALNGAGRISSIAGLRLLRDDPGTVVARGLLRAALELPNPREPIFGVDPYARTPRWKLFITGVLYRLKVGATSFILRVFLRRILVRAALRSFIPLVAIPVYATWNAIVIAWALRDARVRAFGPLAVQELAAAIAAERGHLSPDTRRLVLKAVSEAIVCSGDAHPNFYLLLNRLFEDLDVQPGDIQPDWVMDRERIKNCDERQRRIVLEAICVAVIIDGRIRKSETALLAETHRLCNVSFQAHAIRDLRNAFVRGEGISETALTAVWQSHAS
jgi:hypothetical protein